MNTSAPTGKSPLFFFLLVFALSIPLSLAGTATGLQLVPGLPVSALVVTFCPLITALILVYIENKSAGVSELLKRAYDYKRIKARGWYAVMVLLMPGALLLSYGIMRWVGSPVPAPQFSLLTALGLFLMFFIAALGEELGWMGYAIDPMQERSSALQAGLLLGVAWAAWHIIPIVQAGRSLEWIAWWCLATLAQRVLIVWLYNNTGKSVFAAAVFHAMGNLAWQLFPVSGSFYDPRITGLILTAVALIVIAGWGPKTLARYRYAR